MSAQVSKAVAYAVVTPQGPVSVSKAVAYAVVSTEACINVSKAVAYAVVAPAPLEIISITPNHGPVAGGTRVRIVHNGGY